MRRLALLAIAVAMISFAAGAFGGASAASSVLPIERVAAPCMAQDVADVQQTTHHAGLVIVFPDHVESFCIEFAGDSISGTELLQQSGLPIVFAGFGGLGGGVCRIEEVGCSDPGDCFCQCQGASCAYWSYFALEDGAWRYLSLGPAQHRLRDGDVDGWVWGSGRMAPGDARGPCPATPTPASASGAPLSTPTTLNGGQIATAPVTEPPATSTPSPQSTAVVRAQQTRGTPDAGDSASRAKTSGGGAPVGLIAFGAVAGALAAGIVGLLGWRRLRG